MKGAFVGIKELLSKSYFSESKFRPSVEVRRVKVV
jgi:hypothetical protein